MLIRNQTETLLQIFYEFMLYSKNIYVSQVQTTHVRKVSRHEWVTLDPPLLCSRYCSDVRSVILIQVGTANLSSLPDYGTAQQDCPTLTLQTATSTTVNSQWFGTLFNNYTFFVSSQQGLSRYLETGCPNRG